MAGAGSARVADGLSERAFDLHVVDDLAWGQHPEDPEDVSADERETELEADRAIVATGLGPTSTPYR